MKLNLLVGLSIELSTQNMSTWHRSLTRSLLTCTYLAPVTHSLTTYMYILGARHSLTHSLHVHVHPYSECFCHQHGPELLHAVWCKVTGLQKGHS